MDNKMKVAGLLAGGYLLGRTKKLKLALTVATSIAGAAGYSKRDMVFEAISKISDNTPELQGLTTKITGRLAETGKNAAYSMVSTGVDQLSQKLQDQIDKINDSLDDAQTSEEPTDESDGDTAAEEEPEAEEDIEDAPADEAAEDEEQEPAEEEPAEDEAEEAEDEPADDESDVAEADEEPVEDEEQEPAEDESEEAEADEEPAEDQEQEPAEEEPQDEAASEDEPEEEPAEKEEKASEKKAPTAGTISKGEARTIREWARENDIEVSSRGRIGKDVVQAYREARK